MKKIIFLSLFLACCLCPAGAAASATAAVGGGHPCDIVITGSFDSECIYDFKDDITDEYPDLLVACKRSTVTYTAYANTGSAMVGSYLWEVYGDVSHTASGNQVTVSWSGEDWGIVSVTVVSTAGDTCTKAMRVKLIDIPTVGSATVPSYTVLPSGQKVVYVCEGATIQFIDQSSDTTGDIAGYHWSCSQRTPSSTPNYVIDNVTMDDVVTHRVYNNCGCYDEEEIAIVLLKGTPLELKCYGTVCEDAIVEYQAVDPVCQTYMWYVEGGTLLDGQGTDRAVVQWDHPTDGYGVIGLDGVLCGDLACPTLMSQKVPVVQDRLAIEGQTEACLGEAAVYRLPLWGSTEYRWSITPVAGVDTSMVTPSNEIRLVFQQAGTYKLCCSYRCDFLDCGPYHADTLTITVKPVLTIAGEEQICVANACHLSTHPSVTADWTVYDMTNSSQPLATATDTAFSHLFSQAGRYLVTAAHSAYCGPATFVLTVKEVPPAPTVSDMSPGNRHTACPLGGVTLQGTPSEPHYSLVWAPACTTAVPQHYSGDSVAVSYQGSVCDIHVYNYDRVLQCQSSGYYVHQMAPLAPAALNIPPQVTVCPGSLIVWGTSEVPDQRGDGMLYEWKIEPTKQYCASVQGSHQTPAVTLVVNNIATPETFYVELIRSYCGGSHSDYIYIHVDDSSANTLTISGPDTVCIHTQTTYIGGGSHNGSYQWTYRDYAYQGNPASVAFDYAGTEQLLLQANPYDYCTNRSLLPVATKNVVVKPEPPVLGLKKVNIGITGSIQVYPLLGSGYSYSWQYQATGSTTPVPLTGNVSVPYAGAGTYWCTVTKDGCSKTVAWDSSSEIVMGPPCDSLVVTKTYDPCNGTLLLNTPGNLMVSWTIHHNGDHLIPEILGPNGHNALIDINEVGIYNCIASQFTISCTKTGWRTVYIEAIPDITLEKDCGRIILHNRSKYADGSTVLHISVTNSCTSTVDTIELPAGAATRTYSPSFLIMPSTPCTYTFTLTGIGNDNSFTPCPLATVTLPAKTLPPIGFNPVSITSANANNNYTCDNTPIQLTASLNTPGEIVSSNWTFGDGSSFETIGNSIYHTFSNVGSNPYSVSVTITDTNKCTKTSKVPLTITSYPNDLNGGLNYQNPYICPNTSVAKDLTHTGGSNTYDYYWYSPHATTPLFNHNYIYPTYYQGDYKLYVENIYYCKKELSTYVKFLSAPTAVIYAEHFTCCVGDKLKLHGRMGPSSAPLDYLWTITDPTGGNTQTYTTPNVVFTAPNTPGTYTVTLTVTNAQTTCSATATETVTVTTPPAAPTISVVGSPCISDAPVQLAASGYSGEVHWSNGESGATARYFTHGLVSAYYFDPALGCPSAKAQYRIDRQPDFDALLTGCYTKCSDFFDYYLPVYGLTDDMQTIGWAWSQGATTIATGSGTYTHLPLQLPLVGTGDYQLGVSYEGGACNEKSPLLSITGKKICDCDSISITYSTRMTLQDCLPLYEVTVTICNDHTVGVFCAEKPELINHLDDGTSVTSDFASTTIAPNGCYTFHLYVTLPSLVPSVASFRISDEQCAKCEKTFSVDLTPEEIGCEKTTTLDYLVVNTDLSNPEVAYLDFGVYVDLVQTVLAFWTEPPMAVDYLFDGVSRVDGLLMVDLSVLTQLMAENGNVCFYALVCNSEELCKLEVCIQASDIYLLLANAGIMRTAQGERAAQKTRQDNVSPQEALQLVPDPTTGRVSVTGASGEIVEIKVLDMNGRQAALFADTADFDITALPAGMYIVRVKTKKSNDTATEVTYLKLVKK